MPYIIHRDELQPHLPQPGWQQLPLMNELVAAKLDADLRLNILQPEAATSYHYHQGCEHYILCGSGSRRTNLSRWATPGHDWLYDLH